MADSAFDTSLLSRRLTMMNKRALSSRSGGRSSRELWWGVILIGVGLFFALDSVFLVDVGPMWDYWPVILIVVGARKLLTGQEFEDRKCGVWLAMIGSWLLLANLGLFGGHLWPLLLIGIGGVLIWQSLVSHPARERSLENGHGQS